MECGGSSEKPPLTLIPEEVEKAKQEGVKPPL